MKHVLYISIGLILLASCSTSKSVSSFAGVSANTGYFIIKYKNGVYDTLSGIVTNKITNWRGAVFPEVFEILVEDSTNKLPQKKDFNTKSIRYGKVFSSDNHDSLEYRFYQDTVWQVIRKKENIEMIYTSYFVYNELVLYNDEGGIESTDMSYDIIRVLKNNRIVADVPTIYLSMLALRRFIKNRYHKKYRLFTKKEIMLDYIIDQETRMQNKE